MFMNAISRVCAGILLILLVAGCGGSTGPTKYKVSGKVTLDGAPLETGRITFKAADGKGVTYSEEIKAGAYSTEVTAGKKKVEITSLRKVEGKRAKVGGNPGDPISADNPADVFEEAIPAKYNDKTTLDADVTSSGSNQFDYNLTSDKK